MHLILAIAAGMIAICVLLMGWAMFRAKPDPNERNDDFDERDIYNRDVYNMFGGGRPDTTKKVK